jgi:hypothetical protein
MLEKVGYRNIKRKLILPAIASGLILVLGIPLHLIRQNYNNRHMNSVQMEELNFEEKEMRKSVYDIFSKEKLLPFFFRKRIAAATNHYFLAVQEAGWTSNQAQTVLNAWETRLNSFEGYSCLGTEVQASSGGSNGGGLRELAKKSTDYVEMLMRENIPIEQLIKNSKYGFYPSWDVRKYQRNRK